MAQDWESSPSYEPSCYLHVTLAPIVAVVTVELTLIRLYDDVTTLSAALNELLKTLLVSLVSITAPILYLTILTVLDMELDATRLH